MVFCRVIICGTDAIRSRQSGTKERTKRASGVVLGQRLGKPLKRLEIRESITEK